ncbi:MAG: tyrosine-type recombinase/integrase [Nitrospirales bacterium]|nr:tyrosine-type recombinase/integrase [Nitrospirales bacterium]
MTEVETLLNTLDESTPEALRNKTIIYLLLKTGMREIEVVRANIEDYQATPEGHILRVQGKGRHDKTEFVVILPEVQVWLERYLATRPSLQGEDPLFLTMGKRHGHRLAPRTLRALSCG